MTSFADQMEFATPLPVSLDERVLDLPDQLLDLLPVVGCSLGDCAYAPAPSIKPMAVVINKRSLMFHSLCWCWPKDVKLTLAGNALFQIAAAISSWRVGTRDRGCLLSDAFRSRERR